MGSIGGGSDWHGGAPLRLGTGEDVVGRTSDIGPGPGPATIGTTDGTVLCTGATVDSKVADETFVVVPTIVTIGG